MKKVVREKSAEIVIGLLLGIAVGLIGFFGKKYIETIEKKQDVTNTALIELSQKYGENVPWAVEHLQNNMKYISNLQKSSAINSTKIDNNTGRINRIDDKLNYRFDILSRRIDNNIDNIKYKE